MILKERNFEKLKMGKIQNMINKLVEKPSFTKPLDQKEIYQEIEKIDNEEIKKKLKEILDK